MSKIKKWIVMILCVCFVAMSAFSVVVVASHADHEGSGKHCKICLEIAHLQNTLRQFCIAVSAVAFMMAAVHIPADIVEADRPNRTGTLTSLKVQLNN